MSSKVHSQRNVPFSWENRPGVSKAAEQDGGLARTKLPPPPCPPEKARVSFHDLQIPLPPCAFQAAPARKGVRKVDDDPFLIAYREVTKGDGKGNKIGDLGFGVKKNMSGFSCKRSSCSVAEDSVIRLAQLPISRSRNE